VQFLFREFAGWQFCQVGGDAEAGGVEAAQFDVLAGLAGAGDQAEWGFLAGSHLLPLQPAEVEFRLPLVGRLEAAEFQVDGDEPAQAAVVEKQVEVVVVAVDGDALLPGDEGGAAAGFEDERLQFAEDAGLDVLLGVGVLQAEETGDCTSPGQN